MSPPPGPLVDPAWLVGHLDEVVVADVRWYLDGRSGAEAFAGGHIPGAVFVDLDRDLAGEPGGTAGRHPLPTPEAFSDALGRLGIADRDAVVAYDDSGGSTAARLWWMLDATGRAAGVLDGGLPAWTGPRSTVASPRPRTTPAVRPWPSARLADAELVDRLRLDAGAAVLDARAPERHRGDVEPIDARPGHIPGSRNAPWAANLDADGRFVAPERLRAHYEALGAAGLEVVATCGSGVTACHDLLALAVAGLGPGRLYPGSWSGWSADPARPAATGDAT